MQHGQGVRKDKSNKETVGCCGDQDIKKNLIEPRRESMDENDLSKASDEDKLKQGPESYEDAE
jgi:hypothetical protein